MVLKMRLMKIKKTKSNKQIIGDALYLLRWSNINKEIAIRFRDQLSNQHKLIQIRFFSTIVVEQQDADRSTLIRYFRFIALKIIRKNYSTKINISPKNLCRSQGRQLPSVASKTMKNISKIN